MDRQMIARTILAVALALLGGCAPRPAALLDAERARLLVAPAAADAEATTSTAWMRALDRPRRWTAAPSDEIEPDIAPGGERLAYVSDADGSYNIYLLDLPPAVPSPPRLLAATAASERSPRFSPDGRRLAFVSTIDDAFGDIWIADVSSGKTRRITDRATRDAAPAWMPDGRAILFASSVGGALPHLEIIDIESGRRSPVATSIAATDPDVSPDGAWIACVILLEDGAERRLALLERATGRVRCLTAGQTPVRAPRFVADGSAVLFARAADDTDANGRIDTRDNWTIWRAGWTADLFAGDAPEAVVEPATLYPLTVAAVDSRSVAPFEGGFFLASAPAARRPGDIFSFGARGAVAPPGEDAGGVDTARYAAAAEQLAVERPYEEDLLIAVWRQLAFSRFDGTPESLRLRARLSEVLLLEQLGRFDQAAAQATLLTDSLPLDHPVAALAAVEWERIQIALVERATARAERLREARSGALERLERLHAAHAGQGDARDRAAVEVRLLSARLHADMQDWDAALRVIDRTLQARSSDAAQGARALLLRAYVLRNLGLDGEARAACQRVMDDYPARPREAFEAARRIIEIATSRRGEAGPDPERRRALLRTLIAAPGGPALLRAVAQNRIGDLYVAEQRLPEALEAYAETAQSYPDQVEAVAASHFARSRVLYDQGRYAESVQMYERIEQALRPRDDAFYRRARHGFIRQTILKADAEYRMGDPLLARATCVALRDYDPSLAEAWRGILRSDAALKRVPATLTEIDAALAATPPDAPQAPVLQYARGLALSYLDGREREAVEAVQGAAVLDPASPYPHQTLGYLFEQRAIRSEDRAAASRALYEYQLAVALADADLNPANAAALLVNAGNVCRLLDVWSLAQYYYARRADLAAAGESVYAFEDPRTEYLFWRHAGEAAFKAGDSAAADRHYARALEMLPAAREKAPADADWEAQRTEMTDRRALARQEMGDYPAAADLFGEVAARASDPRARALATRNRGVNLYLEARGVSGAARNGKLTEAWHALTDAALAVDQAGVQSPAARRSRARGLLNIAVVVGLGQSPASDAAHGFDKKGEQRLIEGFLGHIAEAGGNAPAALDALSKQIAGQPAPNASNRAYVLTERAVLLSRMAALCERMGRVGDAASRTIESLEACAWGEGDERTVNQAGTAAGLMNLARLWDAHPAEVSPPVIRWIERRAGAKDGAHRSDPEFAAELLLGRIEDTERAIRTDSPGMAPAMLPRLAFHRGILSMRLAEAARAFSGVPAPESFHVFSKGAEALIQTRRAAEAFDEAALRIDAAWNALRPGARAGLRRLAVAARLHRALCLRALAAIDAVAEEAEALDLANGWGYDDLLFSYWFERGRLLGDDAERTTAWTQAAAAADAALPRSGQFTAGERAALATVGAAFARRAAGDGDWETAWGWSEWASARDTGASVLHMTPDFEGPAAPVARSVVSRRMGILNELDALRRGDALAGETPNRTERLREEWGECLTSATAAAVALGATLSGQPFALADAIELASDGTVFLRLTWLGDGLLAIVAHAGGVDGRVIDAPEGSAARALIARAAAPDTVWSDDDLRTLGRAIFAPLEAFLAPAARIVLFCDAATLALPIETALLDADRPVFDKWAVVRSPSTVAFYVSQTRPSPWRHRLLTLGAGGGKESDGLYEARTLESSVTADDVIRAARDADVVRCDWPLRLDLSDSAASAIHIRSDATPDAFLHPDSLFSARWGLSCLAAPLLFQGPDSPNSRQAALNVFLNAALWGGCPTMAFGPSGSGKTDALVWSAFWRELASAAPAEAMRRALAHAREQGVSCGALAAWRVWGSPGLTPDAARAFLDDSLNERMASGKAAFDSGDFAAAAQAWGQALGLLQTCAPEDARVPAAMEYVLNAARRAGQAERGARVAADMVAWRERHAAPPAEQAEARVVLAVFLSESGRADEASAEALRAIELFTRADDAPGILRATVQQGIVLENAARFEEALESFRQARRICADLESPEDEARQWRRIARLLWLRLNRYGEAAGAADRALDLYGRLGDAPGRALVLLDLAAIRERQGDFVASLEACDRATSLSAGLPDPALASRIALQRANVHWLTGDYRESLVRQTDALRLATEADNAALGIAARNAAGLIRWTLNDHDRALEEFAAALDIARRTANRAEEASTLNNIGLVHRSRGEFDIALARFGQALEMDTVRRETWGQAYDLRNIGMTHLLAGDASRAAEELAQAAELARSIGDWTNLAKARLSLGDALAALGRPAEAAAAYDEALAESRRRSLREVQWRALDGMARLALAAGERAAARERLEEAIGVVEAMRASIRVEELQDGFLADKQTLYERMILLLLDEGRTAEAFEFNERARGRSFIDLLGNQRLPVASGADAAFLERERTLRNRLRRAEAAASAGAEAGVAEAPEGEARKAANADAEAIRREMRDLCVEIRARRPELSAFVEVRPPALADIQSLLDKDVALVEYFLGESELIVWVVRNDSISVVRRPADRAQLEDAITQYRRRIQAVEPVEDLSRHLYERLVAPVADRLAGVRVLAIVPHRTLHYLSFASLRAADGDLIDRYALFYLPSAAVLRYTHAKRRDEPVRRVLALGDPALSDPALELPFARKEAERLRWNFAEVDVLTGERATEAWLRENAARYGVIHIASHGEFDSAMPLLSAVLLAQDDKFDGELTVADVFSLTVNADLVTLSACQSGLAKVNNGDDLVGLGRAFVYAGTHAMLTTLWRVDDVATAVAIKHFYRRYGDTDKAEALRRAQVRVRRAHPHPAYWAGLVLTGDWR